MSAATGTEKAVILEIGTVIAEKWVILDFIGKGAMGEVYRAHQINLQRDISLVDSLRITYIFYYLVQQGAFWVYGWAYARDIPT